MIAILILAALQATSAPPVPTEEEIVITAQRMKRLESTTKVDSRTGTIRCWITVSSGDPRIDWQMCEINKACAALGPGNKQMVEQCLLTKEEAFLRTYVRSAEGSQRAQN